MQHLPKIEWEVFLAALLDATPKAPGEDGWRISTWKLLPRHYLVKLCELICHVEQNADFSADWVIRYVLIPKPGSDSKGRPAVRPIGLTPSMLRMLTRARARMMRRRTALWQLTQHAGTAAQSCQLAAQIFGVRAESAKHSKKVVLTLQSDVAKAFEHVNHGELLHRANAVGLLAEAQRAVRIYRQPRRLLWQGMVGTQDVVKGAAVAGCSQATVWLHVYVRHIINGRHAGPCATVANMVDDINIQFIEDAEHIADTFEQESERFFAEMTQVQLPINYAKTVVLAAPTSAEKLVLPYIQRCGIKAARHSKFLGSQIIAGRRRRTPVLQKRLQAASRRLRRARATRKAGARMGNPIRAAVTALGVWGAGQTGVAETNIRAWRTRFFRTHLKLARGVSPHLVLLVSKAAAFLDPAAAHHRDIFITWQQLIRDGRVPSAELDMALGGEALRLATAKSGWSVVAGPAGALLATCVRLGIVVMSPTHIQLDGDILDLRHIGQKKLQKLVDHQTSCWSERIAMQVGDRTSVLHCAATRAAHAALPTPLQQSIFVHIHAHGAWCQQKLHERGGADHSDSKWAQWDGRSFERLALPDHMGRIYRGSLPKQSSPLVTYSGILKVCPSLHSQPSTLQQFRFAELDGRSWSILKMVLNWLPPMAGLGFSTVPCRPSLRVKRLFPAVQHIYCDNMAAVTGAAGGPNRDRVLRATDAELWQEFFRPSFAVVSQVHKVRAHQSKPEDGFEAFLWAGSVAADMAAKHSVGADIQGEE
eukprot:3703878-Amphidinium_carterae.1